jgi:aryl-alcohol dehydrogenase-like predicted oxidoreductase
VPIFGTKRRTYLDENLAALTVDLTESDLKRISEVVPHGVASGARYPEAMMQHVNR